jgi:hypothetical protein
MQSYLKQTVKDLSVCASNPLCRLHPLPIGLCVSKWLHFVDRSDRRLN